MSTTLRNTVIRASAGTGKTHALTNRILTLLLGGVMPERIIALTFNRTAAGEIFDTAIGRLAKAARGDAEARALAAELRAVRGNAPLDAAKCRETLRRLLLRIHLSPIGTIDSFFVKIIRAFPFEYAVGGEFAIAGENEQALQRERILRALLRPPADDAEAREQRGFFEAFKRATFGREEKKLHDLLAAFVEEYHQLYLNAADLGRWGGSGQIWGRRADQWQQLAPQQLAETATALRKLLADAPWTEEQQAKWEEFIAFAADFTPESSYSSTAAPAVLGKLLEKLPADPAEDDRTRARITLRREVELSEKASGFAFRLARHVGACVLHARRETTRGIGEILARFDDAYDAQMRRAGRLTFGDIQFLLSGGHGSARVLSGGRAATEERKNGRTEEDHKQAIDYRLDAAYDHWALDEFQDTSRRQWHVIENLLDEVIQDPSGERSALIVGDVKQAIYGWRGGDSRLMEEIIQRYNGKTDDKRQKAEGRRQKEECEAERGTPSAECRTEHQAAATDHRPRTMDLFHAGGVLAVEELSRTWRCRPAIVETVNRVFTRLERTPELENLQVCDDWNHLWVAHESAKTDAGRVEFRVLPKPEGRGSVAESAEARLAVVCRRLLEVRPWERGLTAAVLVRGNRAGRLALDVLRRSRIPCALFGEERLADNPLALACLSLVKAAAHPGDTLAWEHLRMTPLAPALPPRPGAFAEAFLREVYERGFEAALRPWVERMLENAECRTPNAEHRTDANPCMPAIHSPQPAHSLPAFGFTKRRAEQLLAAAQEFDADGSRDCAEFAEFVRDYRLSEPPAAGAVQIMTMHKSKGLGFDLVFLPDLQADNICSAGIKGLHADVGPDGVTRWVLDMPGQAFSGADAALREAVTRADRAGCFEELCLLYVAMTRAKRELQIVATEPGKAAKSTHLATVLANALSGLAAKPETDLFYSCGDADWWTAEGGGNLRGGVAVSRCDGETVEPLNREPGTAPAPLRTRHPRRLPSHAKSEPYPAGNLFAAASAKGREHGTALHALFQELSWTGAESVDEVVRRWRAKSVVPADIAESAERAFRRAMAQPEVRAALAEPTEEWKNGKTEKREGGRTEERTDGRTEKQADGKTEKRTVELWREKSFELILDSEWVSGTMDRVVLLRNAAGVAESAEILDYKSDRLADEAALQAAARRYAPQMALYRKVLSRLAGLKPEKIRCRLLFTSAARAVDVG